MHTCAAASLSNTTQQAAWYNDIKSKNAGMWYFIFLHMHMSKEVKDGRQWQTTHMQCLLEYLEIKKEEWRTQKQSFPLWIQN